MHGLGKKTIKNKFNLHIQHNLCSSLKFYQIINETFKSSQSQIPQDLLFTKFIHSKQSLSPSTVSKIPIYSQYFQKYPTGSIQTLRHKNTDVTFVSTNLILVQLKKIYKTLSTKKPDIVITLTKPQNSCDEFKLLPKSNDGIFSDRKYLQQLCKTSEKCQKILNDSENMSIQKGIQYGANQTKQDDKLLMKISAYYCGKFNKKIVIGGIPESSFRQRICNENTLMQLQQVFKNTCKQMPKYKVLSMSPFQMGCWLYPGIFLYLQDIYLATVIQMAISAYRPKSIIVLAGIGQGQSLADIIRNDNCKKDIIDLLVPPGPHSSIMSNIEGWQIIEKHILMDVLQHQLAIVQMPAINLQTTNKIIKHYGINLNQYDPQMIAKFRFEITNKYLKLMNEQIKVGKKLKDKQFMREALRQSKR